MRRFSAGLLVVALAAGPAVPEYPQRGEPIEQSALRSDLRGLGYRNARLPDDLLVEVESNNKKRCLLEREAAEAWETMLVHAALAGIRIEATSCYRDLRAQQESYDWNCPLTDVPVEKVTTTTDELGNTTTETVVRYVRKRQCRVPTSKPGNSNHGWGRAVDITSRGRLLSCRSKTFRWLQENAASFGFVHPTWAQCGRSRQEPWHWEWAGTTVPEPVEAPRHFML